ncbi:MAG: YggT family protein [Actinobacteria bacterium]|nr:YggT family protein [Actinomycetota bacterium]
MFKFYLLQLLSLAFEIYFWLIIIRVIFSWIPVPNNRIFRSFYIFVYEITEPFLSLIRRFIPVVGSGGIGIDFSPFIAVILLQLIERALFTIINILF